jgi:hypothetical protein
MQVEHPQLIAKRIRQLLEATGAIHPAANPESMGWSNT